MRRRDRLRRFFARSDVQTVGITSTALLLAVFVPGLVLYTSAASEALEEVDHWFDFSLHVVVRQVDEHGPEALENSYGLLPSPEAAVRLRAPTGELLFARGDWPDPRHEIEARLGDDGTSDRGIRTLWLLRGANWIVGERVAATGTHVELALPLRHFASETSEIGRRVAVAAVISASVVLLIGLATTVRAFLPLRRATAMLRAVEPGSLGLRVPSRSTDDPIDRHAETLNGVLGEIDAALARLRSFSSDAAHELRTPLNRISTVTEVALLGGGERELRAALEAVQDTIEELAGVIQALLLLAEIDDRRVALRPLWIDLPIWIGQHVEAYSPSFEEEGVKLVSYVEGGKFAGDRVLLDRVIANLLDNALTHAPSGSSVEIFAAHRFGGVSITVDDAGPGIPEADRERVFDRFVRLQHGKRPGHGLGLALARAIAELHGGILTCAASPLGGARFEMWLPRGGPSDERGKSGSGKRG